MQNRTITLGELTCRVLGPTDPTTPEAVVILCHGFGAPGDDLVPLAHAYLRQNPELATSVQFVFPEAPLTIPEMPQARAWWPIDMLEMQSAIAEGRFRDLRQSAPPQLPTARDLLRGTLEALQQETDLPWSKFILGGFSQGSMLATDVALRLTESPGALVIYSGTLIAEPEWRDLAPNRNGLPVFQSHGTNDPILPYEASLWLRDLLDASGLLVDFHSFAGVHTIPPEAIPATARLIEDIRTKSV